MISTTVVSTCPHCDGEHLQKNGHTSHGAQRAKCVDCQRTFTLAPKGPRYDQKFKDQVGQRHVDGCQRATQFGGRAQLLKRQIELPADQGAQAALVDRADLGRAATTR